MKVYHNINTDIITVEGSGGRDLMLDALINTISLIYKTGKDLEELEVRVTQEQHDILLNGDGNFNPSRFSTEPTFTRGKVGTVCGVSITIKQQTKE